MARNKYDVDEALLKGFDIRHMGRLGKYIGPHKFKLAFVIFLMFTNNAASMMLPLLLQRVLDIYIPAADMRRILFCAGLVLLIALYCGICSFNTTRIMSHVGQNIIHGLRHDLFCHLQKLPFSYYDDRPHGKIQVRVVNYINNISSLLSSGVVDSITQLCSLIFVIIFMFLYDVNLALICLCGLPLILAIILYIKKKQRVAWQISSNKISNLNAYIAESINGIRVTQSFVREKENTDIFNNLSNLYRSSWMRAVKYSIVMDPAVDIVSVLTLCAVYLFGVQMVLSPDYGLTVGVLIAFTSYIGRLWAPIHNLANIYNSLVTSMSYLDRIFETLDEPVNVTDSPDAVEMPPIRGAVMFREVSFGYEPGQPILSRVNFAVNPGETYAIVGPTGAGKTTIVNLISRFYNVDSGHILIDGQDISKVTIHSLRSQMGVMMQDSFIFAGTIMDNIRYGNRTATDEQVITAAKTVCAHDFIMSLENGYYTQVNERGSRLSAGQRQLISFARALLADPKILILDEATSNIDTETELLLQQGLARLLENRTSFIIAHRLSTIKNADCIMYVDRGNILERGSHEELLQLEGYYYDLYMSQFTNLS